MLNITTQTLAINAAFLKEIKDDHDELRRLLGEAIVSMTESTDIQRIANFLAQMHDQLLVHFYLEEAYGYFEDAIVEQPWLGERAEILRGQHESLATWLERIAAHAACLQDEDQVPLLLLEFQEFLEVFQRHEQDEVELVMAAFHEDIGVGD